MNFKQWYENNYPGTEDDPNYNPVQSKEAWDACKKEVLKILKENRKYSNEFCMLKMDEDEIIEEIENL